MKALNLALIFVLYIAKCQSESKLVSTIKAAITLNSDESEIDDHHLDEAIVKLYTKDPSKKFLPPGCPDGQTFCENPAGYPSAKYLRKLISNFTEEEHLILFTNNQLTSHVMDFSVPGDKKQKTKVHPAVQVSEDHDWYQESPLCDTRTSYVYPKAALNQNLQWRYLTVKLFSI